MATSSSCGAFLPQSKPPPRRGWAARSVRRCHASVVKAGDHLGGDQAGRRFRRELRARGYSGGYTAVTDVLQGPRPSPLPGYEVRFEPPGGTTQQRSPGSKKVVFDNLVGGDKQARRYRQAECLRCFERGLRRSPMSR